MDCSMPGFLALHYLQELAQTHVHWVIDAIQPSVAPFSTCFQVFPEPRSFLMNQLSSSGGQRIGQLQHLPLKWYSGLISSRINWFDLLAVQETLKSLLQEHSSQFKIMNSSVLSLLYGTHLWYTSINEYWKKNSFDYMNICWQCNVSAF